MWVETSRQRLDWMVKLVERERGLGEVTESWFSEAVKLRSNRVSAPLPPDGWLLLSELTMDEVYGPRGFGRPRVKPYQVQATQDVVTAVNVRWRHPALSGRRIFGLDVTHIPAWYVGATSYSAWHQPGHRFVILSPQLASGWTLWRPASAGPDLRAPKGYARLFEEANHLAFAVERKTHR